MPKQASITEPALLIGNVFLQQYQRKRGFTIS